MLDEGVPIESRCRYCGGRLLVVGEFGSGIAIKGLRALEYAHADTGDKSCHLRPPDAAPFDPWRATKEYEKALRDEDEGIQEGGEG